MDESNPPTPPRPGAHVAERPHDDAASRAVRPSETGANGGEAVLGKSQAGSDANAALRALAHTARSFILYDAANERIRGFLEDVRAKFEQFLATHGELHLDIRPWDIVLDGEVVYSDRDRERSLAFRLYRDGVRRLVVRPELEWSELIALIGILSVRYKGVRTQEDDLVTLLWRADFRHIEIAAVEGLVAGEDDESDIQAQAGASGGPRNAMQAMIFNAPYHFDYPCPHYTERGAVEFKPIPATVLSRVADEDGTDAVPHECIRLVKELLAGLADPLDPLALDDVIPVLREIRGFLVGDNYLDAVIEVVRTVQRMAPADQDTRGKLLAACADAEAVRTFILALTPEEVHVTPALLELMAIAPGDHLGTLLDLFTSSLHHRSSPLIRELLEARMEGQSARVAERMHALGGQAAIALFGLVAKRDPAGAVEPAARLLGSGEEELQLEALRFLEHGPYGAAVGRSLVGALSAPASAVRLRALAVLARHRESRAFGPLVERLRRGAAAGLALAEARAAGEALAWLDPEKARPLFKEWVRPPGLLGRLAPGQTTLRWAAVSGLAHLPGKDTEELLEWLVHHTGDDLQRFGSETLAHLRRPKGGAPGA
jgi:hypothetical protein